MPYDNTMLIRLRAEYLEMPGLRLTPEQAQRLCGVERTLCKMVLDALVDAKFLCVKSDGAYARLTDGVDHPPLQPVKAALKTEHRHGTRRIVKAANSEVFALSEQEQVLPPQVFLTQPPAPAATPPPPEPKRPPVCPKCGSHQTRLVGQSPERSSTYYYGCEECSRLFACRIGAE